MVRPLHGQASVYPSHSLSWFHNTSQERSSFLVLFFPSSQVSVIAEFQFNLSISIFYSCSVEEPVQYSDQCFSKALRLKRICTDVEHEACQLE